VNIDQLVASFDARMTEAQVNVAKWQAEEEPKMAQNNVKITEIKNNDAATIDADASAVLSARKEVQAAQHHVDSLSSEIDAIKGNMCGGLYLVDHFCWSRSAFGSHACYWFEASMHAIQSTHLRCSFSHLIGCLHALSPSEHCREHCHHWYSVDCYADNAWRDAKIGGLEIAKTAADTALEVARGVFTAAAAIINEAGKIVPEMDPEVLALEADNAAIEGAGKTARALLSGVQGLVDGAAAAATWILNEIADIFNIRRMSFAADSLQAVGKEPANLKAAQESGVAPVSFQISFTLSGSFAGHEKSWSGLLMFPPSPSSVLDDIMTLVKAEIQGARLGAW
jgi:hypothetical protein